MSATQARKQFGFENALEHSKRLEACIDHALCIRKSVDELAVSKERAVLSSFGIQPDISSETESTDGSTDECTDSDDYSNEFDQSQSRSCSLDCQSFLEQLQEIVKQSDFNWFEVNAHLEDRVGPENIHRVTIELSSAIDQLKITKREKQLLEISHEAFLADEKFNSLQRTWHADMLNGCIVTDSESDDPDAVENAVTPLDPSLKGIIQKRMAAVKRRMQRLKAKRIEEQRFLCRRKSKKMKGIIKECPDIGEKIEEYVKSCNVGADAWRRTGVLTFDGNSNVNKRSHMKEFVSIWSHTMAGTFLMALWFNSVLQEIEDIDLHFGTRVLHE